MAEIDTRFLTPEQAEGVRKATETVEKGITPPGGQDTRAGDIGSEAFLGEAAKRLLETSGIISSEDTQLEKKIEEITGGVEKAREATTAAIESKFGREIAAAEEQFAAQRQTFLESGRGFAMNTAALKQLDESTEKSLRDLEQRKQELILAGEASAAEQISNLQLKAIEFRQNAQQQAFSNLLGVAGLGLEMKREERLEEEGLFDAQKEVDKLLREEQDEVRQLFVDNPKGLEKLEELGLSLEDVTDVDEAIEFLSPFMNERERLDLQQRAANIRRTQAETKVALKTDEINNINLRISGAAGADGILSFEDYLSLREGIAVMSPSEFDEKYGHRLSEDDRLNLRFIKALTD